MRKIKKAKCLFIRTITHHYTGELVKETNNEFVLTKAAWIADDGRFANFLLTGIANEVEPYPIKALVHINKASVIDWMEWEHPLPMEQK